MPDQPRVMKGMKVGPKYKRGPDEYDTKPPFVKVNQDPKMEVKKKRPGPMDEMSIPALIIASAKRT